MAAAILTQGLTALRDNLKTFVTHIGVSDDTTAFALSQTVINPGGGALSTHGEVSTEANVDATTFDATIDIDGTTEFTGKVINTIAIGKGAAMRGASTGTHTGTPLTVGTDCVTRSLRGAGLGIGVQAGDAFTIGVRVKVEDNS
jgi:hypothetical protein